MATRREVVRDVVATTAPHELELLNSLDGLDEDEITAVLLRPPKSRDPVGFGASEVSVMVAPVVWIVVSELVKRGTGVVADTLFGRIRSWWHRLRGKGSHRPAVVPRLTPQQLNSVHERTVEHATAAGLAERDAARLADAVVSALARGRGQDTGSEPGPPE